MGGGALRKRPSGEVTFERLVGGSDVESCRQLGDSSSGLRQSLPGGWGALLLCRGAAKQRPEQILKAEGSPHDCPCSASGLDTVGTHSQE